MRLHEWICLEEGYFACHAIFVRPESPIRKLDQLALSIA